MELNTIQTEGTWNEIAEKLNDNFSKIITALKGGTGSEPNISLDVSKFVKGYSFTITEAQYKVLLKARQGKAVFIVNSNISYNDEWGQVISCYRQYVGSSTYSLRLSIIHKDGTPNSNDDKAMLYNIDIWEYASSGKYTCTVTSINNLY